MNEPKRLIAEPQSVLAHELLRAVQSERVPDALRQRMAEGLAVTLGASAMGAAGSLGGTAGSSTAGMGSAGMGTAGMSTGVNGASAGVSWAGSALWLKGVLTACALTGAVGLGGMAKQWFAPAEGPVQSSPQVQPTLAASADPALDAVRPSTPEPDVPHPANANLVAPSEQAASAGPGKAARRLTRNKAKVAASAPAQEPVGDLGREVRLLDAARRAIVAGDIDAARERLAQYNRAFPDGALRAEAASLAKAAANAR